MERISAHALSMASWIWGTISSILAEWYDQESIDDGLMEKFDAAYVSADSEEWWREKYFGNVG